MHHIAVLHDVILAFQPELPGLARAGFPIARHIVRIGDSFGADEALLEIGVDRARRLV